MAINVCQALFAVAAEREKEEAEAAAEAEAERASGGPIPEAVLTVAAVVAPAAAAPSFEAGQCNLKPALNARRLSRSKVMSDFDFHQCTLSSLRRFTW